MRFVPVLNFGWNKEKSTNLSVDAFGGDKRDRTADLLNAIQALSQLSYTPKFFAPFTGDVYYYSKGIRVCQHFFAKKCHVFSFRHRIDKKSFCEEGWLLRRKSKQKPNPVRRYTRTLLFTVILLTFGYLYLVQTSFKPTLEELAEYECRAIVVQAMNEAVSREMEENPLRYQDLYQLEYAGTGELQAVCSNTPALNQARTALIQAVEQSISLLDQTDLEIPFGSLTGITALGGLGPSWELSLLPDAYVEGTLREEVQSVSVNRTQYTITLDLKVTISMVLDGNTSTAQVCSQIPVASILLNGDTPTYYAAATQ